MKYEIVKVVSTCVRVLKRHLDEEKAIEYYIKSQNHAELHDFCRTFLLCNIEPILKQEKFAKIPKKYLLDICDNAPSSIPEIQVCDII